MTAHVHIQATTFSLIASNGCLIQEIPEYGGMWKKWKSAIVSSLWFASKNNSF